MALSEIPAEMPLIDNFTSFREEIRRPYCSQATKKQFVLRAEKLRGCLDSVAAPEHSGAL